MKKETLYDAIGGVDEALIEGAAKPRKSKLRWLKWVPVAACLAVVVGYASLVFHPAGNSMAPGMGENGSGGSDNTAGFHSYAGPILPLAALEGGEGLTAERDVTFDFADGLYRIDVTDCYTLHNHTESDVTVELLYPVISSLRGLEEFGATITVDGGAVETTLLAGDYTGGFRGAGGDTEGMAWNLDPLRSWQDYAALLSDGSYLAAALGDHTDLSGVPVTVYQFTNAWGPEETDKIPNPTIRAYFDLDYNRTTVLTYGFHGGLYDRDKGLMGRSFSIRKPTERDYGQPFYLIVVGDDIENLTTEGYVTGGWDTQKTIEYGVDITRYETDLDTALREVFDLMYEPSHSWPAGSSREQWYTLFCDYLAEYGDLERYSEGMLSGVDFAAVARVCWQRFTVTVPAGGSVEVTASMTKESSHNYPGAGGDDYLYGYELTTQMGSNLTFTRLTAAVVNGDGVIFPEQNFGFDPESGIAAVELDLAVERYYFNVMRSEE